MKIKPRVFIASSSEALDIANATQSNLEKFAECTVWNQNVFKLSKTLLDSLVLCLNKADFGIFVFSLDDIAKIRTEKFRIVRDNVLLELGLFIGRLGIERCFILMPEQNEDFHLPTDLLGLKPGEYDIDREDGNIRAALNSLCQEIVEEIKTRGKFSPSEIGFLNESVLSLFPPSISCHNLSGYWLSRFSYSKKREGKVITGFQYDLEHLVPIGQRSLFGSNIYCISPSGKDYFHDIRVQVLNNYLLGSWYNTNTQNLGAFQLYIHTHNTIMSGKHIGNSNDNSIQEGEWIWIKVKRENERSELSFDKSKTLIPLNELGIRFSECLLNETPIILEDILT